MEGYFEEIVPEEDEPIFVTAVDYCLLCGQIAVLYDLEGNTMKRERQTELNYHDLFDYLCNSLEVRKNSRLKKCWNFYTGPFPFCVECEGLMSSLAAIYEQIDRLKRDIKYKIGEAEEIFVREQLYQKQDYRYSEFRKYVLGEQFRGTIGRDDNIGRRGRRSGRQPKLKIETTTSMAPVKTDELTTPKQEDDAIAIGTSISRKMMVEEQASITPVRRSLRVANRMVKQEKQSQSRTESVPVIDVEVVTENFETGTSMPLQVKNENEKNTCEVTTIVRRSGRKRKHQPDFREMLDPKLEEIENVKQEENDQVWSAVPSNPNKKRRGRKKRVKEEVAAVVKMDTVDRKFNLLVPNPIFGLALQPPWQQDEVLSMGNTDLYVSTTPWVKDPLSGNIYYRNLQFVWVPEGKNWQCGTCSVFISHCGEYALKQRFHNHFIKNHSDRFKCRLCPQWNFFQNDLELHQHFRHCHPGYLHYEPVIPTQRRATTVAYRDPCHPPKKSKKQWQPKPCVICGKPLDNQNEKQVEKHRLSHMNQKERATYLKTERTFETCRHRRRTKTEIKGQFSSWQEDKKPKVKREVVKQEVMIKKRRGRKRKHESDSFTT